LFLRREQRCIRLRARAGRPFERKEARYGRSDVTDSRRDRFSTLARVTAVRPGVSHARSNGETFSGSSWRTGRREVRAMNRLLSGLGFARAGTLFAVVAAVALIALPASAKAAPPTVVHVGPFSFSGVTLDAGTLCDFPISFSGTQEYTQTTFYESDGTTVAMRITQGTEQDTFSANGKTLVGDEYHFTFRSLFENGTRVAVYEYGNTERVPLGDGSSVYIVAGETLVTGSVVLSVDNGNSGNNVAAFCAALS
jgi:hypothetical protein